MYLFFNSLNTNRFDNWRVIIACTSFLIDDGDGTMDTKGKGKQY
ncbi:MAG: hypothetical protein ABIZ51_03840 [Bacteroidia bacterium]